VLNTFLALDGAIAEHTSLDAKTREAIHLTVANVNACDYCQGAYTMAARGVGFDEEQTKQIRRGAVDGDEQLTAALTLALRSPATSSSTRCAPSSPTTSTTWWTPSRTCRTRPSSRLVLRWTSPISAPPTSTAR
jgi:AhpD family alkylhydroperoxidase